MNPPMFGSWTVEVRAVRPFAIHGDQYFELHVTRVDEPDGSVLSLKVPLHAIRGALPAAGEKRTISFLAGQVSLVKLP